MSALTSSPRREGLGRQGERRASRALAPTRSLTGSSPGEVSLGSWAASVWVGARWGDSSWAEVTSFLEHSHILKSNGSVPLCDEYTHPRGQRNAFPERALQTPACTTAARVTPQPGITVTPCRLAAEQLGVRTSFRSALRQETPVASWHRVNRQRVSRTSTGEGLDPPVRSARITPLQRFWRHIPSCVSSTVPPCLKLFKIPDPVDDTRMRRITVVHAPPLYRPSIAAAEASRLLLTTALRLPFSSWEGLESS